MSQHRVPVKTRVNEKNVHARQPMHSVRSDAPVARDKSPARTK